MVFSLPILTLLIFFICFVQNFLRIVYFFCKGHASWSTEKSVVTGIQAATELANDFDLKSDIKVIPAASDTAQLSALRQFARTVRGVIPSEIGDTIKPPAPWTLARRFF
jgi:hypothetical protein